MRPVRARPTWLCPDEASRQRLLDMDARILRPRATAFAVLGLACLSTFPEYGVWPFAFLVVVVAGFAAGSAAGRHLAAPEYAIFATWCFAQVMIAVAIAYTGGANSFAMSWLIVPIVTLPARFNTRGVAAGVAFTAALMLLVTLGWHAGDPGRDVYATVFPLAGLVAAGFLSTALMRSDVAHRTDSVIDGLTGLLNRRALSHRLDELEAQSLLTREPVAVIAGDLDRFKAINDEHGHAKGDAVLVDVAYRLRKGLRAFDLAYRIGGEEFVVLLPGASVSEAAAIAEQLRQAVADEPVAGLAVTISFGVAGTEAGGFDREQVLAAADDALYEAKAAGRDRVVAAGAAVPV